MIKSPIITGIDKQGIKQPKHPPPARPTFFAGIVEYFPKRFLFTKYPPGLCLYL